ncbi:unnamed protein product [Alternaria alternata]
MPPKAATLDGQKVVPADCVSVLLMALGSTTITKAQYDMMSALDGTRTASSFEHQFRTITAKAKELKARAEKGETFQAVAPVDQRGQTSPATPNKRKAASSGSRRCDLLQKEGDSRVHMERRARPRLRRWMTLSPRTPGETSVRIEAKWEEEVFSLEDDGHDWMKLESRHASSSGQSKQARVRVDMAGCRNPVVKTWQSSTASQWNLRSQNVG